MKTKSNYDALVERLSNVLEKLQDKHWDRERAERDAESARRAKEAQAEAARKREELDADREKYVEFCERLVSAGASAGKVPTFSQWRGGK